MAQFEEANTVRDYVRDLVTSPDVPFIPGKRLPRQPDEVLLEGLVREALIRLNPEIAADPRKADEVIYTLRALLISARNHPHPVVANQEFMAWLTGQKSMPFGPNGQHTTVRLINFDRPSDPSSNQWIISTEVTFEVGRLSKRFDLVLWCNGFPLVVGEAKTPVRAAYSWIDAAAQIHDDYEASVPQFFVPNVLLFATEGKDFHYGSVGMPVELWGPWREEETDPDQPAKVGLAVVREAVEGALTPESVLDFLRFFTVFATDARHRKIKITENEIPREEKGKAALTELFEAVKGDETPIIVSNVVNRIDEVVRAVRFEGWQSTIAGDQEVRKALRQTLYIQFKIRDNDVFEKALGYVREYY